MKIDAFLERAWTQYQRLTPDAGPIHALMTSRGESIVNDHIAYRTFSSTPLNREALGRIFEAWGFAPKESLSFPEKKLEATYYQHPDPALPKVFISELRVDRCSESLQKWIASFSGPSQLRASVDSPSIFFEPQWGPVDFGDYERFYAESEYAAWTAAFGVQVNHFTVLFNSLRTFSSLEALNSTLESTGILLSSAGGKIKGTPQEGLEQSSTAAKRIPCTFAEGRVEHVMGCYYEFARRYPLAGSTSLFQGFIPKSADKIFESNFEKIG